MAAVADAVSRGLRARSGTFQANFHGTQSNHPDQQGPITTAQSTPRQCPPQCNIKLMAQKQILDLKPAPRLEQIANGYRECVQEDGHHHTA